MVVAWEKASGICEFGRFWRKIRRKKRVEWPEMWEPPKPPDIPSNIHSRIREGFSLSVFLEHQTHNCNSISCQIYSLLFSTLTHRLSVHHISFRPIPFSFSFSFFFLSFHFLFLFLGFFHFFLLHYDPFWKCSRFSTYPSQPSGFC